jgi:hypothetical protein
MHCIREEIKACLRNLFSSLYKPCRVFPKLHDIFYGRLDMKLMFKLRNWERFHFQVAHEQRQVHQMKLLFRTAIISLPPSGATCIQEISCYLSASTYFLLHI